MTEDYPKHTTTRNDEARAAGALSQRDLARTIEAHAEALDTLHTALRRALDTVARCGVVL